MQSYFFKVSRKIRWIRDYCYSTFISECAHVLHFGFTCDMQTIGIVNILAEIELN